MEQLQEAREEKKRIRKKLRDFEDNFFRQNGRHVSFFALYLVFFLYWLCLDVLFKDSDDCHGWYLP